MKKTKYLFTVWPIPGHFYPNIAIAHALETRGHEVVFYTGSKACSVIEQEGFCCFSFNHLDEDRLYSILFSEYRSPWRWKRAFLYKTMLRKWLVETIPQQVADLEELIEELQPNVLICDPTMWGPVLVLHQLLKIPVAISSFVPCCMLPGPDAPPFGLGLSSPRDWHSKLLARIGQISIDIYGKGFRNAVNEVRKQFGLDPLKSSVTEFTRQMPLYLVPSSPEFDYSRRDLPQHVHYVGPCLWNKPGNQQTSGWLNDLKKDTPWVHVTEGTIHVEKPLVLQAAARGLANLPMQVIMTTGGNRDPADLHIGPVAPNVHLKNWISHSDLLPHVDVLVTTGGAGTVLAALEAGVPLVIIPTEWDKPEIAQRVVESGTGLRLSPKRCTPGRLRSAVECVLANPCFRKNVQRIRASFSRYGGPDQAAELLEHLSLTSGYSPETH